MLSLMQLLHHLFQQTSIAKEARKALTQALQHINMDQVFKDNYRTFAFAGLSFIEPKYQRRVYDLPQLWDKVDQWINRDDFFLSFSSECRELDLPFAEYDLDSAFVKPQTEWAEDLMVATADQIVKWFEDEDIPSQVAFWDNGHICVDTTLCVKYRDWSMMNYLSELGDC